ncbi:ATP-binding protein [Bacillus manliponensis]|uniref:ATP-binding protein n=1 Tax=Bacillus manliponensis TaxID=574376 RepID=UPI0035181BF2
MNKTDILAQEEIKALKIFLGLFYIVFFFYYTLHYLLGPNSIKLGLGISFHILVVSLIIPSFYLIKMNRPYIVKYMIFIGYNLIDLINKILIYGETNELSLITNTIELFLILFCPLFVNQRYFFWVIAGIILKYTVIGLVLKTVAFIAQLGVISIIFLLCWIMLVRVQSYINTVETIHKKAKRTDDLAVIGKMATTIGHEIRNPLTALNGFTKLQAEKHPEDFIYYDIMTKEIERMNEILSELMLFGKPKSKDYQLCDIEKIIIYMIQVSQPLAVGKRIKIKAEFEKDIPNVYCDEKQMKQVFLNLLKNAIEAMPNGGGIVISVATSDDVVNIYITDTGCGIVESRIPKLGEAFYTTKESGTGLGLMVTYKIIEEHGGNIQFVSNVGEGTTVELTLPIS